MADLFNGERDSDEFGFEWADEALSPEAEALLKELSVPIGRIPVRKLAEVVHEDLIAECRQRLTALQVKDSNLIDKHLIKSALELQMTPFILDDVHYEVYNRRKNRGPLNRFVTVSIYDIFQEFQEMHETGVNGVLLQRRQDDRAKKTLIDSAKIEENSVYETMADPEGRYAVRSLFRLLKEDSMVNFRHLMRKATQRRMDNVPLTFQEVAGRAPHFLKNKLAQHIAIDLLQLSDDQVITHGLISRDLYRAEALASPLIEYTITNGGAQRPEGRPQV
jgi:hypothetical protein